jgi:hypothetical protein
MKVGRAASVLPGMDATGELSLAGWVIRWTLID